MAFLWRSLSPTSCPNLATSVLKSSPLSLYATTPRQYSECCSSSSSICCPMFRMCSGSSCPSFRFFSKTRKSYRFSIISLNLSYFTLAFSILASSYFGNRLRMSVLYSEDHATSLCLLLPSTICFNRSIYYNVMLLYDIRTRINHNINYSCFSLIAHLFLKCMILVLGFFLRGLGLGIYSDMTLFPILHFSSFNFSFYLFF